MEIIVQGGEYMCQENNDTPALVTIEKVAPEIKKEIKEGCKGNCNHAGVDVAAQKELCHGDKEKTKAE